MEMIHGESCFVSLGVESNQTKRLVGQICLVTGATREIGRAIAQMMVLEAAQVCICGRREEAVDQAVAELAGHAAGKVEGKAADVRDSDQVAELFRFIDTRFGGLDVLVKHAGVGIFKSVSEISLEQWKATIETSFSEVFVSWVFWGTREALLRFETRGRGYIVNIGSRRGRLQCFEIREAAMQDLRSENVRTSYVVLGSVASGSIPEGICARGVAEVVKMLLLMPARTLVSRVEVRPSKPSQPGPKR
jgi:3-oxoacyl-[acyl-carrier protein] reductase